MDLYKGKWKVDVICGLNIDKQINKVSFGFINAVALSFWG